MSLRVSEVLWPSLDCSSDRPVLKLWGFKIKFSFIHLIQRDYHERSKTATQNLLFFQFFCHNFEIPLILEWSYRVGRPYSCLQYLFSDNDFLYMNLSDAITRQDFIHIFHIIVQWTPNYYMLWFPIFGNTEAHIVEFKLRF